MAEAAKSVTKEAGQERTTACETCGEIVPTWHIVAGLCEGCRLDTWLPVAYWRKENYVEEPAFGHHNATAHPPTGVAFLDDSPPRIRDLEPSPYLWLQVEAVK